jgi:hypothetical protein
VDPHRDGLAVQSAITMHEGSVLLGVQPVLEPDDLVVAEAGRKLCCGHDPDADALATDAGALVVALALEQVIEFLNSHLP